MPGDNVISVNTTLHDDEISIDIDLVRKLVDNEFPQYAALPLSRLGASGSTNVLFRLGDELLVRLPRQPDGSKGIDKEQRWTPEIGRHLPVAVPEIVTVGVPAFGFNEQWSILRWLDGQHPEAYISGNPATPECAALAADLAEVILALRATEVPQSALTEPTLRWYRGRSLSEFDKYFRYSVKQCRLIKTLDLDLDAALAIWSEALKLPGASEVGPDRWYHSDLVAENLLLNENRLTAVLDFGGLAIGDPTIDLHGAWELFDPPAREIFRARLGVDDAEWLRGRAWALGIAIGAFSYYWEKMPGRIQDRLAMARAVLADAG